jgi:hypothetical protein
MSGHATTLASTIALGDASIATPAGTVSVPADPTLVMPLIVTALAQRIPGTRGLRERARKEHASVEEQRLLA